MNTMKLRQRLEVLLTESQDSIVKREKETLEKIVGKLNNNFLLFGAGNLGRKTLKILSKIGQSPMAFIDNNPALWGKSINNIVVMSPAEAASKFNAVEIGVITTIWCGEATDKMSDRIRPLQDLGFKKIALFGHLAWKFEKDFLPHYCLDLPSRIVGIKDKILSAFDLLSDEDSRELFVNHIEWRLFLDYDLLPPPSSQQIYFNKNFSSHFDKEVLYDIGAFDGDSIQGFIESNRGDAFLEIHSFEPSPNNFEILNKFVGTLDKISGKVFAHQLALGDEIGSISVESEHGPASRVGSGNITVPVTTIDEFAKTHLSPTFIKIDIEGFEPNCLLGAKETIKRTHPVIAVCVYHLQDHIWEILLQLNSYYPSYNFFLCPHLADGWDLVLYAIPANRLPN